MVQIVKTERTTPRIVTEYLIVAVSTESAHRHIVKVHAKHVLESATDEWHPLQVFTVSQVIAMMAAGTSFFTYSRFTGKIAYVNHDTCGVRGCRVKSLRSAPDAVGDNNLARITTI